MGKLSAGLGRLTEMIQESLNPVSTFTDNTLDEGSVYVSMEDFRKYVEALEGTVAPSDDQIVRVELAKHVARALLELKTNQPQAAWDRLWPMLNPEHTLTEEETYAIDTDWGRWQLCEWCAMAAVRCGKIPEAFQLKDEEGGFTPFETMAYVADQHRLPDALARIIRLQTQIDASNPGIPSFQIRQFLLQGRDRDAFEMFVDFYNKQEESGYAADNLLQTYYSSPEYWDQLFDRLPADRVDRVLASNYTGVFSIADAERLLQIAEQRQLPKSALVPLQIAISDSKGDYEQLNRLFTEWMAIDPEQTLEAKSGFVYLGSSIQPHRILFDHLIRTKQLDQARQMIEHVESAADLDSWSWKSRIEQWKLSVLISEGNVAEVQKLLSNTDSAEATALQTHFDHSGIH